MKAVIGPNAGIGPERGFKWLWRVPATMYRAILPNGDIACAGFDRGDRGVEVYTEDERLIAFIPYENLVALVDEEATVGEDRATM